MKLFRHKEPYSAMVKVGHLVKSRPVDTSGPGTLLSPVNRGEPFDSDYEWNEVRVTLPAPEGRGEIEVACPECGAKISAIVNPWEDIENAFSWGCLLSGFLILGVGWSALGLFTGVDDGINRLAALIIHLILLAGAVTKEVTYQRKRKVEQRSRKGVPTVAFTDRKIKIETVDARPVVDSKHSIGTVKVDEGALTLVSSSRKADPPAASPPQDVSARIHQLIACRANVEEADISEASSFESDLRLPRGEVYELVADVEEEFQISIPHSAVKEFNRVSDLMSSVAEFLKQEKTG